MNNMPPIVKNLLIINLLCFAASWVAGLYNIDLNYLLGLHYIFDGQFHIYQLLTYMFLHHGFEHIFFNMFAVWMFGRIMESQMGSQRFLIYYLTCGIGAGIIQELAQFIEISMGSPIAAYTVGASGAVYGILLAFGMTFPDERMFVFPLPVPIRAKYFVMGYAALELMSALGHSADGVAHCAHLGGMLVGYLLLRYWRSGGGNRGYYDSYNRGGGGGWNGFTQWFQGLKRKMPDIHVTKGGKYDQDMQYRQRKKEEEEELNQILDKVRKSGYTNLTDNEKRRLFEISKGKQ